MLTPKVFFVKRSSKQDLPALVAPRITSLAEGVEALAAAIVQPTVTPWHDSHRPTATKIDQLAYGDTRDGSGNEGVAVAASAAQLELALSTQHTKGQTETLAQSGLHSDTQVRTLLLEPGAGVGSRLIHSRPWRSSASGCP